ncbi:MULTISPECIES: response regulator transcription factor [Alteromonadaceae]|uniref:response regulator transcription factor n=1 Tax=Alteromonadaceae TaxID=72275 RepID=UPI001C080C16|nr:MULTISPECIES: response regulator transcription factor [Aliiglaciecola]MBU2877159.1 response regulator transcription factor [Aliiglaciecola lipolytica]MDO6712089.1 response regulator transcription factor [Aliiglaciecola sp. 2_MG-2023]MDO6753169.1 response regulator transcription factor [Aliiglaciecola sp. 1_MG-2023]
MPKFLIADDHPLFREALKGALTPLYEEVQFVESDGLETTLESIQACSDIDIILLDLSMPGCEKFYGVIRVCGDFPDIPVIVISASDHPKIISQALGYGAKGFVSKSAAVASIAEAIDTVLEGGTWVPEDLKSSIDSISGEQQEIALMVAELTPKQFQVLNYLQEGLLNKQIAYDMDVTEATVKAHTSAIFKKLKVNTRTQAVLLVEKLQSNI